jgi:hypothetical protein
LNDENVFEFQDKNTTELTKTQQLTFDFSICWLKEKNQLSIATTNDFSKRIKIRLLLL